MERKRKIMCVACGKEIVGGHHLQKYHRSCAENLPGFVVGYNYGRRSVKRDVKALTAPQPAVTREKVIASLTVPERARIAREYLERAKADCESDLARLNAQKDLLESEKARAERHQRLIDDGWELPPFNLDPAVQEMLRVRPAKD